DVIAADMPRTRPIIGWSGRLENDPARALDRDAEGRELETQIAALQPGAIDRLALDPGGAPMVDSEPNPIVGFVFQIDEVGRPRVLPHINERFADPCLQ